VAQNTIAARRLVEAQQVDDGEFALARGDRHRLVLDVAVAAFATTAAMRRASRW
jgi:hypothetical protein